MDTSAGRLVAQFDFDLDSDTLTATQNLNPDDYSRCSALHTIVKLTNAATAAADTLDIKLQCSFDGTLWNTRIFYAQLLGNLTATAAAPEILTANITQRIELAAAEEHYEPSGSASATEMTQAAVRNGPFPGLIRTAAGHQPGWRFTFTAVEDTDVEFQGTIFVYAIH